ncbi:MAG: hypothetical protein ACFFAN_09160 [Promethearchaeota archaeon]
MGENGKKKESSDKVFNSEELKSIKKSLISDLMKIDDDITTNAINLVQYALFLIRSQSYNEGIGVLHQAIELYSQVGRIEEINAIKHKIEEISALKEKFVRKSEVKEISGKNLSKIAENFIEKAKELIKLNDFDNAIENYEKAIKFFEEMKDDSNIEKVYKLIEKCYNLKSDLLKVTKKEDYKLEGDINAKILGQINDNLHKKQNLEKYEEMNEQQKHISDQAYNLIDKASTLLKNYQYDDARELYEEASKLFEKLNWDGEFRKVQKTISQLIKEKELFLKELERKKAQEEKEWKIKEQETLIFDEERKRTEKLKEQENVRRFTENVKKKREEEDFHNTITAMVNNAESLSFKYDQEKKKAIKEKKFLQLESPYPRIIQIYENIKNMFLKKGWSNQGKIYNKQIKIYQNKLLKDKKLREIEAQKAKNVKEYEEFFKIQKEVIESQNDIAKLKMGEKRYQKQIEEENFQERIVKMVDEAERLSFNYEQEKKRSIKEKNFLTLQSKYPKIIEIYQNIRNILVEKGWNEQSKLYTNQIRIIKEKMNKEELLRKIEAQKELKQKKFKGFFKVKDETTRLKFDYNKTTEGKEIFEKPINKMDFESQISTMVERAVNLARKYEFAVRKGDHEVSCPYPEIIQIYAKIRHILLDKGLNDEAERYTKQIQLYQKKLESIQS